MATASLNIETRVLGFQLTMAQLKAIQKAAAEGSVAAAAGATVAGRVNKQMADEAKVATSRLTQFGNSLTASGDKMLNWGKQTQYIGRQLTYNMSLPIVAVGAAATYLAYNFDKSMSQVKAAASSTAVISDAQYTIMKQAVLDLSKVTIQSAEEISKGFYELVSAGYSVEESMKMLPLVAQFATASALDMGTAAQFASAQLHAWSGTGITLQEIMDKTALAVQATQLHFEDFVHSMEMASGAGRAAGQSFDETSAALMAMADRGVVAGRMGFYLRAIFTKLGGASAQGTEMMNELGLSFADAQGTIKPLSQIAKEFGNKLATVGSQQERLNILTTVFDRNAATGFIPIMEAATGNSELFSDATQTLAKSMVDGEGSAADFGGEIKKTAKSLDEYLKLVKDSAGAQKRMADAVKSTDYAKMTIAINNLKAAGIEIGMKLLPILTKLVDEQIIPLVNWFSDLSPKTQEWIFKIVALVAVLGPLLVVLASFAELIGIISEGAGLAVGGIKGLITAFRVLGTAITAARIGGAAEGIATLGAAAGGLGVAASLIIAFAAAWAIIGYGIYNTYKKWKENWGKITQVTKDIFNGILDFFVTMWETIKNIFWTGVNAIPGIINSLIGFILGIPEKIMFALGFIAGTIFIFVTKTIPDAMISLGKTIGDAFINAFNWLAVNLPIIAQGVFDFFVSLPGKIFNFLLGLGVAIGDSFRNAIDWLWINLPVFIDGVMNWFSGLPGRIVGSLSGLGASMGAAVSDAIASIPGYLWNIVSVGADIAISIGRAIKNSLGSLGGAFAAGWKAATGQELYYGGIVEKAKYAYGGIVKAQNGFVGGASALKDRVPALLTPGEIVLNRDQQKRLLNGGMGGTTQVTNINLNVGTMIATPGEQREFARKIQDLLNQDNRRFAS